MWVRRVLESCIRELSWRRVVGRKGGGLGTTLVLALVIVVLGVALGVGLARFGSSLPIVGPLLGEKPPRTTTGPVVVEGIQELDQLATVRWTESVPVTRETGGDILDRLLLWRSPAPSPRRTGGAGGWPCETRQEGVT